MAKTIGVWGIDIGRCALKALRCRLDGGQGLLLRRYALYQRPL